MNDNPAERFHELYQTIKRLRAPNGCPWDREQTPDSLISSLIEETFECADALNDKNDEHIKEELGDIFLVLTMIAVIFEEDNKFTTHDILDEVTQKIIRRHPHVFNNTTLNNSDEVVRQWENIKKDVEKKSVPGFLLASVPKGISPYERAFLLQKKAAKNGFDWKKPSDVFDKVREEIQELESAEDLSQRTEELGDLIFSIINLCRLYRVDPSLALHRMNEKFIDRFSWVESRMHEAGKELCADNLSMMDTFWNEKKEREKD